MPTLSPEEGLGAALHKEAAQPNTEAAAIEAAKNEEFLGWKAESDKLDSHQNRDLRRIFAHKVFGLVSLWLVFVCLALLLSGIEFHHCPIHLLHFAFRLSDTVLVALISATAIFGLLGVILDGLFRHRRHKED